MHIPEKYRPGVFIFIGIFTLINIVGLFSLRFDFEIEQLFPKNDPDLQFYQEKILAYQPDKSYLLIAVESQDGVFNPDFLRKIEYLRTELDSISFVKSASALTNLNYFKLGPFLNPIQAKFFDLEADRSLEKDSTFFRAYTDAWEKFMSVDGKASALYLELDPIRKQEEASFQLKKIKSTLASYAFKDYHLSGSIDAKDGVISQLKKELALLFSLSFLFIVAVLFYTFRSKGGIFIPLLVIMLSVVWTLGSMALAGVAINTMTVLVPTIVLIVALSDVIHIMSRFKEEIHASISAREAMKMAMKDIGRAILLTSITTAIGFLSLAYANIQPFVEFGIFTALGVLYAYLLALFLLPQLIILSPNFHVRSSGRYKKWAHKLYQASTHRPGLVLSLAAGMILTSIAGISQLKVDSQMYEEISSADDYSMSLHFLDNNFRGIRPVEIYISARDTSRNMLALEEMQKLDQLGQYLEGPYMANSVYSVVVQAKRLNRVYRQGNPEAFELPADANIHKLIYQVLDSNYWDMELNNILSDDYRSTLVQAKIEDIGSHAIAKKNEALLAFGQELFPPEEYQFKITGKAQILDKSNELITQNLGIGLVVALLIVALIMGLLFRSAGIVALAFIPNILPLLLIAGLMGLLGIGLKMSTAIIYSIAFGIAVDDTIHFLSRLKFEWKEGVSIEQALEKTYLSTGKAIIITSMILIMGFGILLFSGFQATFISGLFISLALLFAVFADLILLPVLLLKAYKKKEVKKRGEAKAPPAYN